MHAFLYADEHICAHAIGLCQMCGLFEKITTTNPATFPPPRYFFVTSKKKKSIIVLPIFCLGYWIIENVPDANVFGIKPYVLPKPSAAIASAFLTLPVEENQKEKRINKLMTALVTPNE